MSDIFISYSTDDKRIAGAIKQSLSTFGIDGFLAHEDLVISELWQQRILEELSHCCIYLAIVTQRFLESDWTDQEAGIAMNRNCLIASLLVDDIHTPHGFLGRHQAYAINSRIPLALGRNSNQYLVNLLVACIILRKEALLHLIDKLIMSLRYVGTFDNAGDIAEVLAAYGSSIGSKANWLFECALSNNQVYGSGSAHPHLQQIWFDNIGQIDEGLRRRTRRKFRFR